MQIFKALSDIKALSFDLDDTLYDNKPIIEAAEQAMLSALLKHAPASKGRDSNFWWQHRLKLAKVEPELRHDIGRWRLLGIEAGLVELGIARNEAKKVAQQGYDAFLDARTRISLTAEVNELLTALAERYQLIAITNGNACINKMGLGEVFEFSLQAGPGGKMKPYPDMFQAAAERLKLAPAQILHIGDSHRADVMGALAAGCQAAWLDHHRQPVSILPHIRLTDVRQLGALITA